MNREALLTFKKAFDLAQMEIDRDELLEEVEAMAEVLREKPTCEVCGDTGFVTEKASFASKQIDPTEKPCGECNGRN